MKPTNWPARLATGAAVAALCLVVSGCGASKVSKENFQKIKEGMSLQEVEAVLGSGTKLGGDGANVAAQFGVDVGVSAPPPSTTDYEWESGAKSITLTFRDGKVVQKKSSGI